VRSMVRRRRVGGEARSSEMSHWMVGNMPSLFYLYFSRERELRHLFLVRWVKARTPYTPQRARVTDDAGELRELGS